MAEEFAHLETPVADSLTAWAKWPDVLADFHQRGEAGVWTRPSEVLPGRQLRTSPPLVVAWGEMTWAAVPAAEPGDPTLVWLQPVTGPVDVQTPREIYSTETVVATAIEELRSALGTNADWELVETLLRRSLRRQVEGILADFSATTALLVREIRRDRRVASALLRALADLPDVIGRPLLRSPVGSSLHRLARRARPPQPAVRG